VFLDRDAPRRTNPTRRTPKAMPDIRDFFNVFSDGLE
jgi:hypothetical protein